MVSSSFFLMLSFALLLFMIYKIYDEAFDLIFIVGAIICLIMVMSDGHNLNEKYQELKKLKSCFEYNYIFMYKQNKLTKTSTKDMIDKATFTSKYDTPKYESDIDNKKHTVYIYQIKSGSDEYEMLQKMYQKGYQVIKDKRELSSETEVKRLLSKMKDNDDYVVNVDHHKKTVAVISP